MRSKGVSSYFMYLTIIGTRLRADGRQAMGDTLADIVGTPTSRLELVSGQVTPWKARQRLRSGASGFAALVPTAQKPRERVRGGSPRSLRDHHRLSRATSTGR